MRTTRTTPEEIRILGLRIKRLEKLLREALNVGKQPKVAVPIKNEDIEMPSPHPVASAEAHVDSNAPTTPNDNAPVSITSRNNPSPPSAVFPLKSTSHQVLPAFLAKPTVFFVSSKTSVSPASTATSSRDLALIAPPAVKNLGFTRKPVVNHHAINALLEEESRAEEETPQFLIKRVIKELHQADLEEFARTILNGSKTIRTAEDRAQQEINRLKTEIARSLDQLKIPAFGPSKPCHFCNSFMHWPDQCDIISTPRERNAFAENNLICKKCALSISAYSHMVHGCGRGERKCGVCADRSHSTQYCPDRPLVELNIANRERNLVKWIRVQGILAQYLADEEQVLREMEEWRGGM